MHLTKSKKSIYLVVFIISIVIISIHIIYQNFFRIDISQFHSISFVAAAISPDEKHAIGVTVYKRQMELY